MNLDGEPLDVIEVRKLVVDAYYQTWCCIPYPGNPDGCPAVYTTKRRIPLEQCPFDAPYLLDFVDLSAYERKDPRCSEVLVLKDGFEPSIWLLVRRFDLEGQRLRMKKKHGDWSDKMCRNSRYWQKRVRRNLKADSNSLKWRIPFPTVMIIRPEAHGVNLFATCRHHGLTLKPNPLEEAYLMYMVARPSKMDNQPFNVV